MTAFHFAFFVADLTSTRRFYGDVLGCREGRSTDTWVDFDFFGHQISAHTTGSVVPTVDAGVVEASRSLCRTSARCWGGMSFARVA
jgi:extradiol dioxygenase family protein